ncbi:MAG: AgmX/PglI C-terminal domain-containing protein [Myxococcota bacterium]
MNRWLCVCGVSALVTLCASTGVRAQGLKGLGPPGGLKSVTPPEVLSLETALLGSINTRYRKKMSSLRNDERLRGFSRAQAQRAAKGEVRADAVPGLIKSRNLAPFGFYYQFVFGADEAEVLKAVRKDRGLSKALGEDYARIGIGAFLAPAEKPFFQVMFLLAKDIDPRAGQPGLSKAQTDPVMDAATESMRRDCYDLELQDNPNFKGQALFEVRIGAAGTVEEAKLLRGVEEDRFDPCILALVNQLTFPKPYKGIPVTLRHPVRFRPPQGDKILGKLSDGQVRSTFARAGLEFRGCYNRRLEKLKGKKLKGRLELSVDVSKTGKVASVDIVKDTTLDLKLQNCVTAIVLKLRFPEPKFGGPVNVSFPLDFGTEGADGRNSRPHSDRGQTSEESLRRVPARAHPRSVGQPR